MLRARLFGTATFFVDDRPSSIDPGFRSGLLLTHLLPRRGVAPRSRHRTALESVVARDAASRDEPPR